MSPSRIDNTIGLWKKQLPMVKPFYAVKCNPAPQLLHHLCDAGIGFDCASERELHEVQKLARHESVDRIIYANPCKSSRDIDVARTMGAPTTVVDSVEEVYKLKEYTGGALVRISVDDSGSAMPFSSKFGTTDVVQIAQAAKTIGLSLRGISFHVGSGSSERDAHAKAIRAAYKSLIQVSQLGHEADTIDIGGGYLADPNQFWATSMAIRGAIQEVDDDSSSPIRWIAEPGRFLATKSFDFYVQVIGKKRAEKGWKYTVDDSLYGQFSSILFDYARPKWVRVSNGDKREKTPGVVFGRTCDSVDVIAKVESMEELEVGDWLWFPAMGAYTRATASEFNGFPSPEVFVDNGGETVDFEEVKDAAPRGVTRMPPVSAKAFWA